MSLTVKLDEKAPGIHVVSPMGSLDIMNYTTLQEAIDSLLEKSPKMIILDLKDLDYITSSGVGVVIKTRKIMKNNNGEILLVNLQPQIAKVFEIIKALPDQRIFNNIEELDRYLDRMQKKVVKEG
ncbi:MAG: STAS domain-containing protein [Deltaproteobacteria bacterium]|nr:STAS domain-containing protein [Deltaproteobacteria bacterium]MDH3951594.1 STAS domain-containing protein [Deltaproteobacteria bacterium]